MNYHPVPISTANQALPAPLLELTERLAENAHASMGQASHCRRLETWSRAGRHCEDPPVSRAVCESPRVREGVRPRDRDGDTEGHSGSGIPHHSAGLSACRGTVRQFTANDNSCPDWTKRLRRRMGSGLGR